MADSVAQAEKLGVFISYSRDDLTFSDQLVTTLEFAGFDPRIDRHGIHGAENWQEKLGALIREADTVVFVLSPSSAVSEMCAWEVEQAVALGKRIIPIVCRPLAGAAAPAALAALNYIFFYDEPAKPGTSWRAGMLELDKALRSDMGWLREQTRLQQRAIEWDQGGRASARLIAGQQDIQEAKAWTAGRPKDAPPLTELVLSFIAASEAWADQQQRERERQLAERERLVREAEAAQAREAEAQAAREAALKREAEAQVARARARKIIAWGSALGLTLIVAGAAYASGVNQAFIRALIARAGDIIHPKSLSKEKERALKPGDAFRECAHCPVMVAIPPGGKTLRWGGESEVHITRAFAVSKFEITLGEWSACVALGGCRAGDGQSGREDLPVISVTWDDANQYAVWLSTMTRKKYRLLSEAEWEYAARAGSEDDYPWGKNVGEGRANCIDCGSEYGGKRTAPVGSFEPNAWGLHDMHGNVWEWVQDYWHAALSGAPKDGSPWIKDGDPSAHVVRGGGWYDPGEHIRSVTRDSSFTYDRNLNLGIRIGRTLELW